jgi:hypothetical protein
VLRYSDLLVRGNRGLFEPVEDQAKATPAIESAAHRGKTAVIYGHTPVLSAEWVKNTFCIDTGCVFGGKLTARRWPDGAILSGEQSLAIGAVIANVDLAVAQPYVNSCRMCTRCKWRIGQSSCGGLSWQL